MLSSSELSPPCLPEEVPYPGENPPTYEMNWACSRCGRLFINRSGVLHWCIVPQVQIPHTQ